MSLTGIWFIHKELKEMRNDLLAASCGEVVLVVELWSTAWKMKTNILVKCQIFELAPKTGMVS